MTTLRDGPIVIVASSREDFSALRTRLTDVREHTHPEAGTVYELGRLSVRGEVVSVALAEIDPGAAQAAIETERALSHWKPSRMLSVGLAVGLADVLRAGDVVVATQVYGYEAGTDAIDGFRARPTLGMADHAMEQQARAEARDPRWRDEAANDDTRPGVHLGPLAAGDKEPSAVDTPLVATLRRHYADTLALERQGYAFHRAAHEHGVPALVVRGVARRLGDDAGHERRAREHAVAFTVKLLERLATRTRDDFDGRLLRSEATHRDVFFDEVLRVAKLRRAKRDERATVLERRGVQAFPRFALVIPEDEPRRGVELLTVHPGTPSRDELAVFVAESLAPRRELDERASAAVVYRGAVPDEATNDFARSGHVRLQSFRTFRGLIDFSEYLIHQRNELAGDRAYPTAMYVPQRMTWRVGRQEFNTEDALDEVASRLKSDTESPGVLTLILGDFGTGKTFLMRQLALRLGASTGVVPLMVNLRYLNKAHSRDPAQALDELLAQHLVQRKMRNPNLDGLRYMMEAGDVVLLFDGFDELALRVTYERAAEHLATLAAAVQGRCRVVVTSRTQHFRNEDQSRTALADHLSATRHEVLSLEKFDAPRIRRFLRNHLSQPRDGEAALEGAALDAAVEHRFGLLCDIKDLGGLAETPRMLGMILGIPVPELEAVRAREGTITAAELYDRLLARWLGYEWDRANPRGEAPGLPLDARWRFVTRFARRLWLQSDPGLPEEAIVDEATAIVREQRLKIDPAVAAQEAGSGTLLVRDAAGCFSFVHQSVLEFLIAREAAEAAKRGGEVALLDEGELSTLMARFFIERLGAERAAQWASAVPTTATRAKQNAVRVQALLDEEFLQGVDFRGQDLREVDLTRFKTRLARAMLQGCNLSGMSLRGFVFQGANLRGAKLRDADLKDADLSNADLTGADLTRAKLTGVRAEGARFDDAVLDRVSFVGAVVDRAVVERAVARGGAPVDALAPDFALARAGVVGCVAFAPTGRFVAVAVGADVWLVNAETFAIVRVFQGHPNGVTSVAFSPDGTRLATGSWDNTARLWAVDSGQSIATLRGHSNRVTSVAFSPDGTRLATGSSDETARLWATDSGQTIAILQEHSNGVMSVAFSPDGTRLATGSSDRTARLWDADSGQSLAILRGHLDSVVSVAFSPDGTRLATGSEDKTARLWDADTGQPLATLQGHWSAVTSVAFSPDGTRLATGSWDNTAQLWATDSGQSLATLQGHSDLVTSVAFSPDGTRLATGSWDNTARLWAADSGQPLATLQANSNWLTSVTFSPDGTRLATGSGDATARLLDAGSGQPLATLQAHSNWVMSVTFSPDGTRLATGSSDKAARLWATDTGQTLATLQGHSDTVQSVAFSPDGMRMATGSRDKTARLWAADTGQTLATLQGHSGGVMSVAFSPNGMRLATGSSDKTARLWATDSGQTLATLQGHSDSLTSVAFNPDGTRLATGSWDNTARLWDADSGHPLATLQGHTDSVTSVAFSSNGTRLATGSEDNTARLWSPDSGQTLATLRGHSSSVTSVAFSPDGELLATASSDCTVRLWHVATARCVAILCALADGWLAYTPDMRYRTGGELHGSIWQVVGNCRFEVGELDGYGTTRLRDDEPLIVLPTDIAVQKPSASRSESSLPMWPDALVGAATCATGALAIGGSPTALAVSVGAGLGAAALVRFVRGRAQRQR